MAGNAISLAVDDTYVYWVDSTNNSIVEADKAAAMPTATVLSTGEPQPHAVASDGAFVYWSNYLGGAVMRKPRTGASADTVVATAVQPDAIAVDDSYVYWAEPPSASPPIQLVRRAPKDGSGTGQTVLSWDTWSGTASILSLAVDSTNLCWGGNGTSGGASGGCMSKNAVASCRTNQSPMCTGASVSFLTGGGADNVTTDGAFVVAGCYFGGSAMTSYWYTSGGLSQWVNLSPGYWSCAGTTQDPRFAYFGATGLTVDGGMQEGIYRQHKCGDVSASGVMSYPLLSTYYPVTRPGSLVVDEDYLYAITGGTSNGGTTIVRVRK